MRLTLLALASTIVLAGCGSRPEPTARTLPSHGATMCQIYVGDSATYYDGMRTCSAHEIEIQQVLPVGQR